MASETPASIQTFCRNVLPLLVQAADGRRILKTVAALVETDRWDSFDRFHETTKTIVREYTAAGAATDVRRIQTGGPVGSGRWIIREAEDIRSATVDIVKPVQRRIIDYARNPWHVIAWSAATPRDGLTAELVVIDTVEALEAIRPGRLVGKMVLTALDPRRTLRFDLLAQKGAVGVISSLPVPNFPKATKWMKFGFGGIDVNLGESRIVGLMVSEEQGRMLRALAARHGNLTIRVNVDIRRYVGTHDVTSGLVVGRGDPQSEVWAIAHCSEPGALDNASGVAVCIEIARIMERLIAEGRLPPPRRSIRLLSGHECFSFFHYLEHVRRYERPLAGVCIDSVGARPEVCGGRLQWNATTPMTAGFIERIGAATIRAALRLAKPGYRLSIGPFVSTPDTLIADPKYGFPCTYLATDQTRRGQYDAYHSSADTIRLLSPKGLAACAAAMAGYLYFLADAASPELMELAEAETRHTIGRLPTGRKKIPAAMAEHLRGQHAASLRHLQRWMWGGDRARILAHLAECEQRVREAADRAAHHPARHHTRRVSAAARRIPLRKVLLTPLLENTPRGIAERINGSHLPAWALYWADGSRSIADIAEAIACEHKKDMAVEQAVAFFEAHAELGYVELIDPATLVTKSALIADLRRLGLRPGLDVIVHSSLSRIGHVAGGAETVIDALLAVLGKSGTLVMPSFNHCEAYVFNPMTTRTKNGAIPDAMWRRAEAVRSMQSSHPVAAIGPRAEALCAGHLEAGLWDKDSPIGRLIHGGGYVLCLGVTLASSTAYHVAETAMNGGCCDQFGGIDRIVMPDGSVKEVPGLAYRREECAVNSAQMIRLLERRRQVRRGKVGKADAVLVRAFDVFAARLDLLRNKCPTCTIKPRSRRMNPWPDYFRSRK